MSLLDLTSCRQHPGFGENENTAAPDRAVWDVLFQEGFELQHRELIDCFSLKGYIPAIW